MTSQKTVAGMVAFWDIWNVPIAQPEIAHLSGGKSETHKLNKKIVQYEQNGIQYFGFRQNVQQLQKRQQEAEKHSREILQKARRFTGFLRHFPFLRAIALTNTPAMGMAQEDSDIDLLLIVRKGRMYTARFWSTLFFAAFGLRARKGKTRGKFCLSFFVDEEYTDFTAIKNERDIYLAFWLATLQPLWGHSYFEKLREENAQWVREEAGIELQSKESGVPPSPRLRRTSGSREQIQNSKLKITNDKSIFQKIWEFLLPDFSEKFFKKMLLKKAAKFHDPASAHYAPEMIFSDRVQKLHHPDRRAEIQRKWEERMADLAS